MKLRVPGDARFPGFRDAIIPSRVTLDGARLHDVVAVDTATGVAWRIARDEAGRAQIDHEHNEFRIERITGSFRVEPGLR